MSESHQSAACRLPSKGHAGDISPADVYREVMQNPDARLVDVRTEPEWMFSGTADLSAVGNRLILLSWRLFPNFEQNGPFMEQFSRQVTNKNAPVYFMCKTGGRSSEAAAAATAAGYTACYNVAGGFEGNPNEAGQRGRLSGWKAEGLPWRQA